MNFISLRSKLIIASFLFIFIPIFTVGIFVYSEVEGVLIKQISNASSDRLDQVNMNMERIMQGMVNSASSIMLDDNVRDVLKNPPNNINQRIKNVNKMDKRFLEISTSIIDGEAYFSVMDTRGNIYTNWSQTPSSFQHLSESQWVKDAEKANGYMIWKLKHENYVYMKSEPLTTLTMVIRDKNFNNKIGTLIISVPSKQFLDILRVKDSSLINLGFIIDVDKHILSEETKFLKMIYPFIQKEISTSSYTFSKEINGKTYEVVTNSIPFADWKVVQLLPHQEIFMQIDRTRNIAIMSLFICILIFIGMIIFISTMFTRPLRNLRTVMKRVESGNLEASFTVNTRDEVGVLGESFNNMLRKLRHHLDKEISLERSKEKAKLEALQAQINPHFLHNTLNTIKWMSITAGTKKITEMLLSLGHLLDMSIHRGQEVITISEELENVRCFITIQMHRFGDTIKIKEEISPETLEVVVPKLSLQPLVENVYKHGVFIDGGEMVIRSRREGDCVFLEVINTGGDHKIKLKELHNQLNVETPGLFSGIGLKNVHSRIQMIFGHNYGIYMDRNEEKGLTCVALHLPYRREWHEHQASSY